MGDPCGFGFFWGGIPEKRAQFFLGECDLHWNYAVIVILLSFLCNYDNLTLILNQENDSYTDEGWIFIGRFKVGSIPEISATLKASKKSIKIHHEYEVRSLIKSCNCYY